MTKELAIRILTGDVLGTSEQTHEAIKIAVEVLSEPSAQPTQTNTSNALKSLDCVDRQAAIDCVNHVRFGMDEMAFGIATTALLELPSAHPERKKGRWALHTYMPHVAYCTICERNSPYNRRWDFCPNCGADMRGDVDEQK